MKSAARKLARFAVIGSTWTLLACSSPQKKSDDPSGTSEDGSSSGGETGSTGKDDNVVDVKFEPDVESKSGKWSDPATWPDGKLPEEGDDVLIAKGSDVVLDVSPPDLGDLSIQGTLTFGDEDLNLTATNIMVHGALVIGTEETPYEKNAVITLTGTDVDSSLMGMGNRGLGVMGGTLDLHGTPPSPTWSKLNKTVLGSDGGDGKELELIEETDWKPGDNIVVAPTDFYDLGRTEEAQVESAEGSNVTLSSALEQPHWGVLQYVVEEDDVEEGMTLERPDVDSPVVLDERAEVGNLTRNIVIQGPDDALWRDELFGAHSMYMRGSTIRIDGVEFRRMGQAGRLARYPVHFHRMSQNDALEVLDDLDGQYVRNSAIHHSSQRCVVVHSTSGLTVENNVCYDISAHAIFLEDGVERRNQISKNLVLHVNEPLEENALLRHDLLTGQRVGPSGFWIANPDNTVEDNVTADSQGHGFWFSFSPEPFGTSYGLDFCPACLLPGSFAGNVSHSNQGAGFMFDGRQVDEAGNTEALKYRPTSDGKVDGPNLPFTIEDLLSYKQTWFGGNGPFWNNSIDGTYQQIMVADFVEIGLKGASASCTIADSVSIGYSLNNERRTEDQSYMVGVATYHGLCTFTDNLFVNFPYVEGERNGVFSTIDFYVRPVDKSMVRHSGNRFVNSFMGLREPSPNVTGDDNWALAGAVWDPAGFWGPPGNYWVYDEPFLTEGATCESVWPEGKNGLSCDGPYYGVMNPIFDGTQDDKQPLEFTSEGGAQWIVGDGEQATKLFNMRHAALRKDGVYTLRSPGKSPSSIWAEVLNIVEEDDSVVLGVPYHADSAPETALLTTLPNGVSSSLGSYEAWKRDDENWKDEFRGEFWSPLTPVGSLDEVKESDGTVYYHDSEANLVWLRLKGGVVTPWIDTELPATDNANLYQIIRIQISEEPL